MTDKQKYPSPLYAVAGFGDYAAEKLRRLPDRVAELQERARTEMSGRGRAQDELSELGNRVGAGFASFRVRAKRFSESLNETDLRRFQSVARRRAGDLAEVAVRNLGTAQDRATHVYDDFVTRGTSVLEGPRGRLHVVAEVRDDPRSEQADAEKSAAEKATAEKPTAEKPAAEETAPAAETAGEDDPAPTPKKIAKKATRPAGRKPVSKPAE